MCIRDSFRTQKTIPSPSSDACALILTHGELFPTSRRTAVAGGIKSTFALAFPRDPTVRFLSASGKVLAEGLPWTTRMSFLPGKLVGSDHYSPPRRHTDPRERSTRATVSTFQNLRSSALPTVEVCTYSLAPSTVWVLFSS